MRRIQLEFRQPGQCICAINTRSGRIGGPRHTNWMSVSTAEETVWLTTVHGTRGKLDKVAALGMVTAVDDLQQHDR